MLHFEMARALKASINIIRDTSICFCLFDTFIKKYLSIWNRSFYLRNFRPKQANNKHVARHTASTRNARSSTNTKQSRVSKFTKATGTYSSTNQLHNGKEKQQETGFTNPQHSSIKDDEKK